MNDTFQTNLQSAIDLLVKSSATELPFSDDVIELAGKASEAGGFLTKAAFKELAKTNPISSILRLCQSAFQLGTKSASPSSPKGILLDFGEWTDSNNQYVTDQDKVFIGPGVKSDNNSPTPPPQGRLYVVGKFRAGDDFSLLGYPNTAPFPVLPSGVAPQTGWYYGFWNDDNSAVVVTFAGVNPKFSIPLEGGIVVQNRAPIANGDLLPFYGLASIVFHEDGTLSTA